MELLREWYGLTRREQVNKLYHHLTSLGFQVQVKYNAQGNTPDMEFETLRVFIMGRDRQVDPAPEIGDRLIASRKELQKFLDLLVLPVPLTIKQRC